MRLLTKTSLRYLWRHPWLMALSVLGVALGVAVVVAIDLANTSAERAFRMSAARVTGEATHQVVGGPDGVAEEVYRRLRTEQGVRASAPIVEGYVRYQGRTLQLLGVDPLADGVFRPYTGRGAVDLGAFLTQPGAALLGAATAAALGRTPGDTLQAAIDGVRRTFRVVGVLDPGDDYNARVLDNLLIVDVATAQEVLGKAGRLSRIDLLVPDGPAGESLLEDVERVLPSGARVVRSETRTEIVEQMSRAFRLNLTALSLLALVVGMFLIYNTMTFSVVQRQPLLGRLRALGVTQREVFGLVVGEAVLLGAVGTVLGVALGVVLGRGLVGLVTQTINDLYYVVAVRELALGPLTLLKGVGLGVGATVIAALAPAREAMRAPVSTILQRSRRETDLKAALPRLTVAGLVLGALGGVLLALPSRSIALSYGALLCVILGFALLAPLAVLGAARAARPLLGGPFGLIGRMAARGVAATLSRTSVAAAALAVAVAATIGIGVMVGSFRTTVVSWLDYSLQADVYVQPPSLVFRRGDATFDREAERLLRTTEGVASSYSVRSVTVDASAGRTELVAIEFAPRHKQTFRFKASASDDLWAEFVAGEDAVLISEPYAYRHGLGVGDTLRLATDRGTQAFPVRAVFYDYGSDLGVAMMSRRTYDRYFDDDGFSGLAFYAAPGADVDALVARMQARTADVQDVIIRSNRALREASLEVFDRTFAITNVLRLLAVFVAFIGVLTALMALQLERARELAVLRAEGMTPGELWRYVILQTGLTGLVAGILALPLGLVLAFVLIYVINRRSFGWTLQLDLPPELLVQAVALAVGAALLAGLYPAWKMARANPASALRDE